MFCGKCGTQNADMATFCAGCGSALNQVPQMPPQPQFAPQQPQQFAPQPPQQVVPQQMMPPQPMMPARQPKQGSSLRSAANKKLWLITMIISASVAVLCIVLMFILGGNGFSSPEDAAEAYVEGALSGDWDECESAFHPDMLGEFNMNVMPDISDYGVEVDDVEATRREDLTGYELEIIREELLEDFGLYVSRACKIRVSYTCETFLGDMTQTQSCTVGEIDGSWYVIEG